MGPSFKEPLLLPAYVASNGGRLHLDRNCVSRYGPFRIDIPPSAMNAFVWCKVCADYEKRRAAAHAPLSRAFGKGTADAAVERLMGDSLF